MDIEEAKWIRSKIEILPRSEISPVLNIGSSTRKVRVNSQPYVDALVFEHLRGMGVRIIHLDIKEADGVDLVGDLTDKSFLDKITQIKPKLTLCNNLLEHLEDRQPFINALCDLIPPGGYLLITVPHEYPKHMDPIDTMYRPTVFELAELFPNLQVLNSHTIDLGITWSFSRDGADILLRTLVRAAFPFIKHKGWITSIHRLLWFFKRRSISGVFLRKD